MFGDCLIFKKSNIRHKDNETNQGYTKFNIDK